MEDQRSQLNLTKMLLPNIQKIKNEKDLVTFAKKSKSIKNIIIRIFPSLKSLFKIEVTNSRSAEKFIKQLNRTMELKFGKTFKESEVIGIFHSVYGHVIKILTALNIASLFAVWSPAVLFSVSMICTLTVLLNAYGHGIPLKQAFNNFKQSFSEYMKRPTPTKDERNLAFIPVFLIAVVGVVQVVLRYLEVVSLGTLVTTTAGVAIMLSFYAIIIFYLMTTLADDWVIRRGTKEAL